MIMMTRLDLRELFAVLWGGKKTILSIGFIGAFFGLVALYLTNKYTAEALLAAFGWSGKGAGPNGISIRRLASLAVVADWVIRRDRRCH